MSICGCGTLSLCCGHGRLASRELEPKLGDHQGNRLPKFGVGARVKTGWRHARYLVVTCSCKGSSLLRSRCPCISQLAGIRMCSTLKWDTGRPHSLHMHLQLLSLACLLPVVHYRGRGVQEYILSWTTLSHIARMHACVLFCLVWLLWEINYMGQQQGKGGSTIDMEA